MVGKQASKIGSRVVEMLAKLFTVRIQASEWDYGYYSRTIGNQHYNQPGMFHFGKTGSWIPTRGDEDRYCGFYATGSTNILFGDGRVEAQRWSDLKFGYDGTPHRNPDATACATAHETGKGLGDRNDRTFEFLQFWYGDR